MELSIDQQANHLYNIKVLASASGQDIGMVHRLVSTAFTLAEAAGEALPGVDQLQFLSLQIGTRCHALVSGVEKIRNGTEDIMGGASLGDVLPELEKRCTKAVRKARQIEAMLKTAVLPDKEHRTRRLVCQHRAVEVRQRLEDGVAWRIEELKSAVA